MLNFLRRHLDGVATGAFLSLVLVRTIMRPPVFATAGGLELARIVLWGTGALLALLFIGSPFTKLAQKLLILVLELGPMFVTVIGYVSLRLLHAEEFTSWLGIEPKDRQMMAVDDVLFGKTPYLWLAQWGFDGHLFQRLMASFYGLYPFMPLIALCWFLYTREAAQFHLIRRTLLLSLYCGYCFYLLFPVAGPLSLVRSSPFFIQSTTTYSFLMGNYRYAYDCFPSLHTANPWLLVWLCRGKLPRGVMAGAVIACLGITLSTMALRQHYGIDILAGLAWAWLMSLAGPATLPHEAKELVVEKSDLEFAS